MKCIGLYITKSIRTVITDKEIGKCKYVWIKGSELMNTSDIDIHVYMHSFFPTQL